MADLSNSSFIPKRGPAKHKNNSATRQVYIFTLVSYILMFATLLGAGGTYFYSKYINRELNKEISLLNTEISSFSETDMQHVADFDLRLQQAYDRLDNSASVVSIFKAIEVATIDTVKFESLSLQREEDEKFTLTASIETDSFDSTIFQRGVYKRNKPTVSSVLIEDVKATGLSRGSDGTDEGFEKPTVIFETELEIPLSEVPYTPQTINFPPITIETPVPSEEDASAGGSLEANQPGI